MARFNIISKTENNDFDRDIEFSLIAKENENKILSPLISSYIGLIYENMGKYSHSLKYYLKL